MKKTAVCLMIILIVLLSSVLIGCNKTPEIFDPKTYVGTYEKVWIHRIIIRDYIEDGLDYMINEDYIFDQNFTEGLFTLTRKKDIVSVARQETSDDQMIDEIAQSAEFLGDSMELKEKEVKFQGLSFDVKETSVFLQTLKYELEKEESDGKKYSVYASHIDNEMFNAMVCIEDTVTAKDGKEYEYQVVIWFCGGIDLTVIL